MIDFSGWTKATGDLKPGQQAVFMDFLTLVADGKAHLVHGANYRDGKPCLVNGTSVMMSNTAMSPVNSFPHVVHAFDEVCAAMQKEGLSVGDDGYVTPIMAEFLIRNFGEVKPIDLTPAVETPVEVEAPYIEPSDDMLAAAWFESMKAPAPTEVTEEDFAYSFVDVNLNMERG